MIIMYNINKQSIERNPSKNRAVEKGLLWHMRTEKDPISVGGASV